MWRAQMDLLGIYRIDNTVLDLLELPEDEDQVEVIDRDVLKDNLLLDTAEMEIIYPDADFLKQAIGAWSKKQVNIWTELYNSMIYDYNPIWNTDVKTVEDRDLEGTDYRTDDHTTERTHDDSLERTHDDTMERTHDDTLTTKNDVYGYNSSTAAPESEITADHDGTITDAHTGTITDAHTGTITDTDTGTIKHDTSDTGTVTTTKQGNIGIQSTQSLIREQRELVQFNLMDYIIKDFKQRFCLLVY